MNAIEALGTGQSPLVPELPIAPDDVLPIVGDGVAECAVAGEGRIPFPAFRQAPKAANRERLHRRFFDPLAGSHRLGVRLPAIGQDVAELMAELIGKFTPVPLADVDDDPGHAAAVGMQPDRRGIRNMLIDAQPRRLPVGEKADVVETRVPHALDHAIGRTREHGELDRRGEERRSLLDRRGKLRHDCHRSAAGPRDTRATRA